MARKKVKLAFIANDSARRATFKKRKRGLLKKVSELSTLCGVNACAIVYGPYERQAEVWPSPAEVHRVLMKFKSLPEMEQSKKMMNQELFLWQRIMKMREQLKKQLRENRYKEITHLMYQSLTGKSNLHDVATHALSDLAWLIEEKNREIRDRIEALHKQTAAAVPNTNITSTVVQTNSTTTNFNNGITGGFNMNNVGGGDHHLLQVGMNMNGGGGGGEQAVAAENKAVDPIMQAAMENLQRQNWFVPDVMSMNMNMNMNLNMNPIPPTHHHDPMMGYLDGVVGVDDHHHHQMQMPTGMGMGMGMAASSSTSYGGLADININNAGATAPTAGWMAGYNPFYV